MTAPARGFPEIEFHQRLEKLQQRMGVETLDALLLTCEADVRYYTGYLTQFWQSPARPWFLVIPQAGVPVAVIPSIGHACMSRTWITDIRTWSSPHPSDDGVTLLADTLNELTGTHRNIGTPMGRETWLRMPLASFDRLKTLVPGAHWQDATACIQQLQQIKSPLEIDKIRHTCTLVSGVFDRVPDFLSSGMSEIDIFRRFKIECLNAGVDDTTYLVGGADTGGYDDIISPASARVLQSGDVLILDTGCTWDGYFCDFDRNFAVNTVNDAAQLAHRVTWEATEAGLQASRPGITCSELFQVMNAVMEKHATDGGGEVGRIGHGLGAQLTESPSITAHDQTVLKPGMVMTLEPGYTFARGKMIVCEENIVIRETGAELLTRRAGRSMPVIH